MSKYRILMVEDEESLRLVYSDYLRMNDFEVVEAVDGEQALDIARKDQDFDIVLLDLNLPKIDGLRVLASLRSEEKTKTLLVYLMTVLNSDRAIKDGFQKGADGYIIKGTVAPDEMMKEIVSAIEKKKTHKP